jgi:hypothetical protein
MRQLSCKILFISMFKSYDAIAGVGINSWNDNREPWEDSSSFGSVDFFFLIEVIIFLAITLLIQAAIHNLVTYRFSKKTQIVILSLLPCFVISMSAYFDSGNLRVFAGTSVLSSIFYFFACIDERQSI